MPRQRHRFGCSRTPSIDECPLGPTLARRTSNASPPPSRGFATPCPASDALSLPRPVRGRRLDLAAFRELIAPVRSRPHVVRRLLPTRRSASTTIGRSTPGLGCADAAFAWSSPGAGPRFVPLASPFDRGSSRTAEPRALGSGAFLMSTRARALLDRHPPAAMARGGGFAPTRCGSDTSCRASALPPAGVAGVMRGAPTNLR